MGPSEFRGRTEPLAQVFGLGMDDVEEAIREAMDGVVRVQRLFMEAPPFSSFGTVRDQEILGFEMGQSGSFLPGLGRERLRRFGEHAVDMPWIENERQRTAWKLNQLLCDRGPKYSAKANIER